jgi:glycosyltransferase involved in cell wall biosynthesis
MTKITTVLHISNTDIEIDSRIRKELKALSQLPDIRVSSLGVPQTNEAGNVQLDGAAYQKLRLASRRLKPLPRAIRYFVQMIEFTFKAVIAGRGIKPDIVHCHDTFALPAGWILKRQLGCHLVYDAHELESNKNAQNAILSRATLLIEKLCWRRVDLLVTVSDSIIEWYSQNLGEKPSVLVLNSPAIAAEKDSRFGAQSRGNYFHEKYGLPNDTRVFVYVGMLSSGRGIEICLDAFAAGPKDAHVVFIGFGRLEQVIIECSKLHSNIHFHEAVPHDQVVSLVRSADYGLCLIERASLSDYYCLPNKLFEYCFARVPVLASSFPEINRVVEQYSLGVCCEPDPGSVREALNRLIKSTAIRVTSDITALSWDAQASRLITAYRDQLMATQAARPSL